MCGTRDDGEGFSGERVVISVYKFRTSNACSVASLTLVSKLCTRNKVKEITPSCPCV